MFPNTFATHQITTTSLSDKEIGEFEGLKDYQSPGQLEVLPGL